MAWRRSREQVSDRAAVLAGLHAICAACGHRRVMHAGGGCTCGCPRFVEKRGRGRPKREPNDEVNAKE